MAISCSRVIVSLAVSALVSGTSISLSEESKSCAAPTTRYILRVAVNQIRGEDANFSKEFLVLCIHDRDHLSVMFRFRHSAEETCRVSAIWCGFEESFVVDIVREDAAE